VETRGEDGGVVAEEGVAGAQKTRELRKGMVRQCVSGAVDHEEARFVAAAGRRLSDEVRGKRVVEEVGGERRHGGSGDLRLAAAGFASFFRCLFRPL
jgi:hypothetical protein